MPEHNELSDEEVERIYGLPAADFKRIVRVMANTKVRFVRSGKPGPRDMPFSVKGLKKFANLEGWVENVIDPASKKAKLEQELDFCQQQIQRRSDKLANQSFQDKAPRHIVNREKHELAELRHEEKRLVKEL